MPRPSWSRTLVGLPTRSWLPAHGARGDAIAALLCHAAGCVAGWLELPQPPRRSPSSGQTAGARATAHRWRRPGAQKKRSPLLTSTCGVATVAQLAPPRVRWAAWRGGALPADDGGHASGRRGGTCNVRAICTHARAPDTLSRNKDGPRNDIDFSRSRRRRRSSLHA